MTETMKDLKARASLWPNPYGQRAKDLIRDAHYEYALYNPRFYKSITDDLREALLSVEQAMKRGERLVRSGTPKGFMYKIERCTQCQQLVKANWYIKHRKSGCKVGVIRSGHVGT